MNWKAGAGTEGGAKRKQSKKKAEQKESRTKGRPYIGKYSSGMRFGT